MQDMCVQDEPEEHCTVVSWWSELRQAWVTEVIPMLDCPVHSVGLSEKAKDAALMCRAALAIWSIETST